MRKIFYILLFLVGLTGALVFLNSVLWQHHAITYFIPVNAGIAWTEVVTHHGGKSTTYEPKIDYAFNYNGQTYDSSRVLPYEETSSSDGWAENIINHFPEHQDATAYINPDNPSESILWRVHSGTPYVLSMAFLALAFLGLFLATGVLAGSRKLMQAIPLGADGHFLLLPQRELRKLRRDQTLLLLAWLLACALPWAHFLWVAEERTFWTRVLTLILAALGVWLAFRTWTAWSNARHMSDARLIVKPVPLHPRGTLEIQIEIDAYRPLQVNSLTASLICVENYVSGHGRNQTVQRADIITKTAHLSEKCAISPGQMLSGAAHLSIAHEDAHLSWDGKKKIYPYWTWEVRIHADLEGTPHYKAIFPINVQPKPTPIIDAGTANQ